MDTAKHGSGEVLVARSSIEAIRVDPCPSGTDAKAVIGSRSTWFSDRWWWLVAVCACALMLIGNVFWREGYTGDEGFYGVTAQNMLHGADYWLRPSYYPLGDFATDRDGFAHPPFNSYFYAVALWIAHGSIAGPEVLNVLNFAALLLMGYRLIRRRDGLAAKCAVLLLAASPAMIGYFSMLEAEPLMTTFGLAALVCALRGGIARGQRVWLGLSGLCLGVSFAIKLWLCGPLGLAVVIALVMRAWECRGLIAASSRSGASSVRQWGRAVLGGLALFSGAFVVPTALHLGAIAWVHPGDVGFWLKNIYFGVFTQSGISGSKFGGGAIPADWVHPVWYYGAALYRDHFFLVPMVLFGLRPLWFEASQRTESRSLYLALLAGLAGLAPLSLMKVKEPLYVLTCSVFLYLIAGLCLAALIRRLSSREGLDPLTRWMGVALSLGLLVVFPLAYARGIQADKITSGFVIAHSVVLAVVTLVVVWCAYRASREATTDSATGRTSKNALFVGALLAGGCAIVAANGFGLRARQPRDPAIAQVLQRYVGTNSPGQQSFIGSNFKCYQYYLFHRGCYWHELPDEPPAAVMDRTDYQTTRAFILDPRDLARPHVNEWVKWLADNATEKTAELDRKLGHTSGFRVWVRP